MGPKTPLTLVPGVFAYGELCLIFAFRETGHLPGR
jgi:hypothetical protein